MKQGVCDIWAIWSRNTKMFLGLRIFKHGHLLIIGIMTPTVSHKVHLTGWETSSDSIRSFHCIFFLGGKFKFLNLQHPWKAARDQHDGENETSREEAATRHPSKPDDTDLLDYHWTSFLLKFIFRKAYLYIIYIYCTTFICTSEINIIKLNKSLNLFFAILFFYLFH